MRSDLRFTGKLVRRRLAVTRDWPLDSAAASHPAYPAHASRSPRVTAPVAQIKEESGSILVLIHMISVSRAVT